MRATLGWDVLLSLISFGDQFELNPDLLVWCNRPNNTNFSIANGTKNFEFLIAQHYFLGSKLVAC
jgi:hypothetical protein